MRYICHHRNATQEEKKDLANPHSNGIAENIKKCITEKKKRTYGDNAKYKGK